jgi:site-specific DNA-methyltransferase (adenine-specific)
MTDSNLYVGDSHNVLFDLIDKNVKVDLIITDPPFIISNSFNLPNNKIENTYSGYKNYKGDWDISVPNHAMWIDACWQLLKPGGIFCIFGVMGNLSTYYDNVLRRYKERYSDMIWQSSIVWEKSNPAPSLFRRMYTNANEFIMVISKGKGWTFNYEIAKQFNDGKQLKNVWKCAAVRRVMERTRKPYGIVTRLTQVLSNPGDLLLDPFCGTGSILETAIKDGRNCIGIDDEEQVVLYAKEQLTNLGSKVSLFY